jgi:hypothetical protein
MKKANFQPFHGSWAFYVKCPKCGEYVKVRRLYVELFNRVEEASEEWQLRARCSCPCGFSFSRAWGRVMRGEL